MEWYWWIVLVVLILIIGGILGIMFARHNPEKAKKIDTGVDKGIDAAKDKVVEEIKKI